MPAVVTTLRVVVAGAIRDATGLFSMLSDTDAWRAVATGFFIFARPVLFSVRGVGLGAADGRGGRVTGCAAATGVAVVQG